MSTFYSTLLAYPRVIRLTYVLLALATPLALAISRALPPATERIELRDGRFGLFVLGPPGAPVLVVLHAALGSARAAIEESGFATAARRHGLSVVFGESRDGVWRFKGLNGSDDRSDEAYVWELLSAVQARAGATRAYIAGESNGGLLALQLVCRFPELFAGLGLINAAMPEGLAPECPALPSRMVVVNGDRDPVFPFLGGDGTLPLGPVMGFNKLGDRLLKERDCVAFARRPLAASRPGAALVTRIEAVGCQRQGVTRLYQLHGGDHRPWGGESWLWRIIAPWGRFLAPEAVVEGLV